MKLTKGKKITIGIVILLLLLLGGLGYAVSHFRYLLAGAQSTNLALSNTVTQYRNKAGQEVTERNLILSSYKGLKAVHASDSSEIGRLQKLVKKGTISATVIRNVTTGTATGSTSVSFGNNRDSLEKVTEPYYPCDSMQLPEYYSHITDKWVDIETTATRDSTFVQYKFFNEYEITQELKKEGKWPFRKKVPIVMVKNLNPHTETKGISSYAVQAPKSGNKIIIAGITGLILGIIGGVLISK